MASHLGHHCLETFFGSDNVWAYCHVYLPMTNYAVGGPHEHQQHPLTHTELSPPGTNPILGR